MIAGDGAVISTQTKGTAMYSAPFKAYLIERDADGKVGGSLTTLTPEQLDEGELTIRVHYSSITYKDALAATGAGKIIRRFPCVGGIDMSGAVITSPESMWLQCSASRCAQLRRRVSR